MHPNLFPTKGHSTRLPLRRCAHGARHISRWIDSFIPAATAAALAFACLVPSAAKGAGASSPSTSSSIASEASSSASSTAALASAKARPLTHEALWDSIAPHFKPPAAFAQEKGAYATPLRFYDGRPVARPSDWPARRTEILAAWHEVMGPWPKLLAAPRVEIVKEEKRGAITQRTVRVEVAAGVFQNGFILLPPGKGPMPAVFVPFYTPETSINCQGPMTGLAKTYADTGRVIHRDFAYGLALRGFVTLAIGSPGGDAYKPLLSGARCQPLSYLAYIAANCHTVLARLPEVDPRRIGVMGHSYGGKWAMFASCLYEKYACGVWSDGGVVFDEKRGAVNYWEPWYLGLDPAVTRARGLISQKSPRTGAYKTLVEKGHDLVELHALMAPRPFLVSGGAEDGPSRWAALNHAVDVNRFLGFENRVAMTFRPAHAPTAESNEQAYRFLAYNLGPTGPKSAESR